MKKALLRKEDIKKLISDFEISKGDTICLQADLSCFDSVVSYQSLIEILQDTVGEEGCILIPSFSFETLDPAVIESTGHDYENWDLIREEMNGYQPKLTEPSVYKNLNAQFIRYKVSRSIHPVYSFTYWGNYLQEYLKQSMDYPISFNHSLKCFTKGRAINLLIGEKKENSVLIPAIAYTMNYGVSHIQRAYTLRNRKNVFHTYLNLSVNSEEIKKILDMCIIKEKHFNDEHVYSISIQK